MKPIQPLLFALLLTTVFSCNHRTEDAREMVAMKVEARLSQPEGPAPVVERKLIREGEIEFETGDLAQTRQQVLAAVTRAGGYVGSDQESRQTARKLNTLVIRIPAGKFDGFITEATAGVSAFDRKDIRVRDVTEEFVDIGARLKTKKDLENRYSDLLKQAKNVTEILEIEKQMAQLRSDIESVEGRLKYLQNEVAYSTITITFYQSVPGETAFGQKFRSGFRNGWDNLIWFFVVLVNLWPFILIVAATFFGMRVYRRKRKAV